ncbi:MAG: gamma-glutamylcyclotransferase family protein [Pseudomonadota bacterium]
MRRVFGYGSLVNRRTHSFEAAPATISGWQRVWVTTDARPAAFLSVTRADGDIDGLLLDVPEASYADLDAREAQYAREPLDGGLIYAVPASSTTPDPAPILASYLDVVLQGFLAEFGEPGLLRFMQTTTGWERGIWDDRAKPIYPRAQTISAEERALFSRLLASVPVVEEP